MNEDTVITTQTDPVEGAVHRLIERSEEIRQHLDAVAYTDELLHCILGEAVRVGAVVLDPTPTERT